MAELTEDTIAKLKAEHGGDLAKVETAAGPVVFRKPTRKEWDRFTDTIRSGSAASASCRELQTACLVWPGRDGYNAALDAQPALLMRGFADALNELAGANDEGGPPPEKL